MASILATVLLALVGIFVIVFFVYLLLFVSPDSTGRRELPPPKKTWSEQRLADAADLYAAGKIDLEEYEREADRHVRGLGIRPDTIGDSVWAVAMRSPEGPGDQWVPPPPIAGHPKRRSRKTCDCTACVAYRFHDSRMLGGLIAMDRWD